MSADSLIVDVATKGLATVTINRPEARNALSAALLRRFHEVFADLARDETVGVVILTGTGSVFCAGLDLKEMESDQPVLLEAAASNNMHDLVTRFEKPVICAVNGAAVTGGFELALACDIIVASTNAFFWDTHARRGLVPGWGLSQRLSRQIGLMRAKEISLTGSPIGAALAEQWGLVNHTVAPDELMPTARRLAEEMLKSAPDMLKTHKRLIDEGFDLPLPDALRLERKILAKFS